MHDDLVPTSLNSTPLAPLPALPTPPLDQNSAAIYLASLAASSRRTMRTALNTIAALLGYAERRDAQGSDARCLDVSWGALRAPHTAAIQASLQERYAPATASKMIAALRRVLREARRLGQISADDYDRAIDLPAIRTERLPRGRLVSDVEVTALLHACAADSTPAGARDAAILALLRGTGLRRSEVAALDLVDYDEASGALTLRSEVSRKQRVVYTPTGSRRALQDWLLVRGGAPGPLFYGVVKGGALAPRRLAGQAMAVICASRAADAGVALLTPHDLRRTFISGLLDAGADLAVVQRLAGHEDPATTSRYDHRDQEARRRAVDLVRVPHFPRTRPT